MRILKIMLATVVLCVVSALSIGCGSEPDAAVSENQILTVQRGDLTVDITAAGNLALSHKVDLAFEMDGTVEEVLVEEAESVEEGQLLAKLDTSAWEDHITELEDKVIEAERNATKKERAVRDAERTVTAKERQVINKMRDLLQAQINLKNAELNLERAKEPLSTTGREVSVTVLDPLEIEIKELQVEIAQGKLEDAQIAIEDAQIAIEDAKEGVRDAEEAVEDAKKALEDAKEALAEAMDASPEVTAPFTGFITKVNVSGGDEVKKGTVAVQLADPNKFEAEVTVSEMDILKVKLGGDASVQVDAVTGLSLPAKVAHISPTAIIQSGVVNYKVKVEVQSLEEAMQEQQEAMQKAMQERQQASDNLSSDNISSGALPKRFRQATEEGRLTQEQLEEMMKQRQQARAGQPGRQQQQMLTMVPEDFQLTEGLTITVSIVVEERNDVLLVPIQAIISRGRETLVQVLKDGVIEERSITVGISNWQYAEITSGLSEGEQVVVPQVTITTPTTPTTPQQRQPTGGIPRQMQRMLR